MTQFSCIFAFLKKFLKLKCFFTLMFPFNFASMILFFSVIIFVSFCFFLSKGKIVICFEFFPLNFHYKKSERMKREKTFQIFKNTISKTLKVKKQTLKKNWRSFRVEYSFADGMSNIRANFDWPPSIFLNSKFWVFGKREK